FCSCLATSPGYIPTTSPSCTSTTSTGHAPAISTGCTSTTRA
ncbi:3872_t:CDS:1, partial [Racocetra persica]